MKLAIMIFDILAALLFLAFAIDGCCTGNDVRMYANLILSTLYLLKLELDERDD